jgi:glutamate formiminotransferase
VLECVPNVSEGRDETVLAALAAGCGAALLDLHVDVDHHRSVFTLAGPDVEAIVFALCGQVMRLIDLRGHRGVHPRLGAVDVVPFVALDGPDDRAVDAARALAARLGAELDVPTFLYDQADPEARPLPTVRRDAFTRRRPDHGPDRPHPTFGATAVGARAPLVAVNCVLAGGDPAVARAVAAEVRERDGGLPGVRALGLALPSRGLVQVSMNLVALDRTGLEEACRAVDAAARARADRVVEVELVGLVPESERARCSAEFRSWVGLDAARTIEGRLGARRTEAGPASGPRGPAPR